MLSIGFHLSISKGFYNAVSKTISIEGNTFQFFIKNPRYGKAKEIHMLRNEYGK